MQFYTAVPMNIRRQAKKLYVWYLKKQGDWDAIHKKNDVFKMPEEVARAKKQLKQGKHTCLVIRLEHPRAYDTVTRLLSRDYRTPINRLQHTYQ